MTVTISAGLLTGSPAPVQIVIQGVPSGTPFEVRGNRGIDSWPVPGGRGQGSGGQIVLVDSRAPLRVAVTYSITIAGLPVTSNPVTIPYPKKYVLQSLDGRHKVDFIWRDNGLPREPVIDSAVFDVPGRRRPPVRFRSGGDGGGSLEIRADRANSATLHELVIEGRPLVVRTDGQVRDLAAVDVILVQEAPSSLFQGDNGVSTQRVWQLSYLLVDDPEPDAVIGSTTWADFNTVYAGMTWAGFNTEWDGQRWVDFNTYDWAQRL